LVALICCKFIFYWQNHRLFTIKFFAKTHALLYTETMIVAEGICKSYNGIQALSGVSFHIGEGEIVGILGRSDSGKTTLMSILSGCIHADSGYAKIGGFDLAKKTIEAKRSFGYVPSRSLLYPDMTVHGFLNFAGRLRGIPEKKLGEAVFECLRVVSGEYLLNRKISGLTRFEERLINFAQAVIAKPPVLLIDALAAGLEPSETQRIRNLIGQLSLSHTILLSTSLLYEAAELCSRVIILNGGKVAADRKMEELSGRTNGLQLRMRIEGDEEIIRRALMPLEDEDYALCYIERTEEKNVFRISVECDRDIRRKISGICAENKLAILEMRQTSVSLEDIYFQLTSDST